MVRGTDVVVLDVLTGEERTVTTKPGSISWLGWSPNGALLAFVIDTRIVLAQPAGGSPEILAELFPYDEGVSLSWSPDGRSLAYVSDQDVWVVPVEGGSSNRLTKASLYGGEYDSLGWHPRSLSAQSLGGVAASFELPVDRCRTKACSRHVGSRFGSRWTGLGSRSRSRTRATTSSLGYRRRFTRGDRLFHRLRRRRSGASGRHGARGQSGLYTGATARRTSPTFSSVPPWPAW